MPVIEVQVNKSKRKLSPGDVVAIPRLSGGYYFVLHLESNRFGNAFGIFEGHCDTTSTADWKPVSLLKHVYSGNHFIKSGRWQIVDHREDLLKWFADAPEIFHSKADNFSNPVIGRFGCGETGAGALRNLEEREALELGLIAGTYRQVMIEEEFEQHLNKMLG